MAERRPDAEERALRDPFFGELRRRHPDVDLVLLPPVDPRPPDRPAPAEQARALADAVLAVAREVRDLLALPATSATGLWWRAGDRGRHRFVVRAAFRDVEPDAVEPAMRRLGRHLLDEGWDAGATPEPRLLVTAEQAPVRLRAEAFERGVGLRVESAVIALDDETVRLLERQVREREGSP